MDFLKQCAGGQPSDMEEVGAVVVGKDHFGAFMEAMKGLNVNAKVLEDHQERLTAVVTKLQQIGDQLMNVGGETDKLAVDYKTELEKQEAELATLDTNFIDLAAKHNGLQRAGFVDPLTLLRSKASYGKLLRQVVGRPMKMLLATAEIDNLNTITTGWTRAHADLAIILAGKAIQAETQTWNDEHQDGDGHCVAFRFGGDEFVFAFVFPTKDDVTGDDVTKAAKELLQNVWKRVNKDLRARFNFGKLDDDRRTNPRSGRPCISTGPAISIGASLLEDCEISGTGGEPVTKLHQLYLRAAEALMKAKKHFNDDVEEAGAEPEGGVLLLGEEDQEAIQKQVAVLLQGNAKAKEKAAVALKNLVINDDKRVQIVQAGALQPLIALLHNGSRDGREKAATALRTLSLVRLLQHSGIPSDSKEDVVLALAALGTSDDDRTAMMEAGVLEPLVKLLEKGGEVAQEGAAGLLCSLSLDTPNRVEIVEAGTLPHLLRVMEHGTDVAAEQASSVVRNLSVGEELRGEIVDAESMGPLIKLLEDGSEIAQENAAAVFRNLSLTSSFRWKIVQAGALPYLENVMQVGTEEAQDFAAEAVRLVKSG